jgi:DNA adenine methylase
MLLEKSGRSYYQCDFTEEDHTRLRDSLAAIKGKFILSYDDHPLVRKLYKGFRIHKAGDVHYSLNKRPGTSPRSKPEVLVTNW